MNNNSISIEPVTSRPQEKAFIRFPWKLYKGDPNWIPPLIDNTRELLNYKPHAFYDNAEIQTFLANEKKPRIDIPITKRVLKPWIDISVK